MQMGVVMEDSPCLDGLSGQESLHRGSKPKPAGVNAKTPIDFHKLGSSEWDNHLYFQSGEDRITTGEMACVLPMG